MKKDSARKKFYGAKLHEKKNMMHVHISKELKAKLNTAKRALLITKGDSVKVMRGGSRGRTAKVARLNYNKLAVYLEGISHKNARGTEVLVRFQPSNLMLTDLNMNEARKKEFGVSEEQKSAPAKKEEPKV